jgi:hypothetical protein
MPPSRADNAPFLAPSHGLCDTKKAPLYRRVIGRVCHQPTNDRNRRNSVVPPSRAKIGFASNRCFASGYLFEQPFDRDQVENIVVKIAPI